MVRDVVELITEPAHGILAERHEIRRADTVGTVCTRHLDQEIADVFGIRLLEAEQHRFIVKILDDIFRGPAEIVDTHIDDRIKDEIIRILEIHRRSRIFIADAGELEGIVLRIDSPAFGIADKADR